MMGLVQRIAAGLITTALATGAMAQFDGPAPLAWRWFQGTLSVPSGSAVVDGDTIYTAVGGRVYALERETGNQLWRFPAGAPLDAQFRTGAIIADGRIFAAADNKIIYAIDAKSGKLDWQHRSEQPISGTPVHAGNAIAFPLATNGIGVLRPQTGREIFDGPLKTTAKVNAQMAAWQNTVIFATNDSRIASVDLTTGKERWTQRMSRLSSSGGPVVHGDTVYINSGGYLIAIRANIGRARWQKNLGASLVYSPAVSEQGVVAVSRMGRVFVYDLNGRAVFGGGLQLEGNPVASPSFADGMAIIPSTGGSLYGIQPQTGEVHWKYIMRPLVKFEEDDETAGRGGAAGGGPGGLGGFGGGGQNAGRQGRNEDSKPKTVSAAGPAILAGTSLLVLGRDGSLFVFDKTSGVDLTPPKTEMLWPNPGDQVSPNPPTELIFRLEDYSSGINPDSIKVTVNGQAMAHTFSITNLIRVKISTGGKNRQLPIGRVTINVTASDWMGNKGSHDYILSVDPTISSPLGSPKSSSRDERGGPGGIGGGGRGGLGG